MILLGLDWLVWLVTIGDMAAIWTIRQEWLPSKATNHIIGDTLLCPVDQRYTHHVIYYSRLVTQRVWVGLGTEK